MVIATKFTSNYKMGSKGPNDLHSNFTGNSAKSLHLSLEASLKKLRTHYLDVLYVHWWDFGTSIEEVMHALNVMVQDRKVLYLGVSDTPAWIVVKANDYARHNGMRPFSLYQGLWNAAQRDFERDILPMCQSEGLAMAPWGALGGGKFKTAEQRSSNDGRKMGEASETDLKVSAVLEEIAKAKGTIITSVALAYVMHTSPDVYPIVGGRNVEHLKGSTEALKLRLTDEEMSRIQGAYDFNLGFPLTMLFPGQKSVQYTAADNFITKTSVHLDIPARRAPTFPPGAKYAGMKTREIS